MKNFSVFLKKKLDYNCYLVSQKVVWNLFCFFVLNFSVLLTSCSKDNEIPQQTPDQVVDKLTNNDVKGVWATQYSNLYFISLSEGGHYSYCLNKHFIGSGTYQLKNDTIYLSNSYSHRTDKLQLSLKDNKISIKGDLGTTLYNKREKINMEFVKTMEDISPSVAGSTRKPQMQGLWDKYSYVNEIVTYSTDNTASYEFSGILRNTHQKVMLYNPSWYYVFRYPYTYTLSLAYYDTDENVIIYDFENKTPYARLDNNIIEHEI